MIIIHFRYIPTTRIIYRYTGYRYYVLDILNASEWYNKVERKKQQTTKL